MVRAAGLVPASHFLEIRYEDLCEDPVGSFQDATAFSGLEMTPEFSQAIVGFGFRNTNDKWKRDLTELQQQQLEAELAPHLQRWGYELSFGDAA